MANPKASDLNGAYYGPSIPPASHSYHRPGRGSSCCCGPCCVLSALFKLAASVVITLGIIVLVLWLVLRPNKLKVYVDDASLSQFNLTNSGTLSYNLTLNLTLRNPNKRVGIDHKELEANVYYSGTRIAFQTFPGFYQGHKNTSVVPMEFVGNNVAFGDRAAELNQDESDGYLDIYMRVIMRMKLKVWFIKTRRFKAKFDCDLKVPLSSGASTASNKFTRTKCDFDF